MRAATWAAGLAFAIGVAILGGYWVVMVVSDVYSARDVPLLLKMALASVAAGAAVLMLVAILQRLRDRREEDLEGIEY